MRPTVPSNNSEDSLHPARAARLFSVLVLAWLPGIIGSRAVGNAAALYPLAESANPYFVPAHAGLLYLWSPLVVASACILFLSPGLLFSLAVNGAKGPERWVLTGFASSLILVSFSAAVVQAILGRPLQGVSFALVVAGCSLLCFFFLYIRAGRGSVVELPFARPGSRLTVGIICFVPVLFLIFLTPKFYWENFNGDGAHAFESARLLLFQPVPFFSPDAGTISAFPTVRSFLFALPASWFVRLFGPFEVSARLPMLLDLAGLYAGIVALVQHGRTRVVRPVEGLLIWLGLSVFVVVMAYSATYNPYCADLALPATQDTLLVVCFLAFILMFAAEEYPWLWLFCALTVVSLPNGTMLIGLWLVGTLFFWKPRPWRNVKHSVGALVTCGLAFAVTPWILGRFGLAQPGQEYATIELLKRFRYIWLTDWKRWAYLAVPCGVLPALALFNWKRQDPLSRALTFVTSVYFLTFYAQAFTPVHYYVPVMLLPLVVYWRGDLVSHPRLGPLILGATAVAGLACLLVSLPNHGNIDESGRLLGSAIEDRMDGYDTGSLAVFGRAELFQKIVPYDWDPRVPNESFGGSQIVWNYYAHRTSAENRAINYVIQGAAAPPPADMHRIAAEMGAALYVRSDAVWKGHRALRPPTPAGAKLYWIPRRLLFHVGTSTEDLPIIDMMDVAARLGISPEAIRKRLK